MKRLVAILLAAVFASAVPAWAAPADFTEEHLAHGRFKDVALYTPAGGVKEVVIFLSGDGGWNLGVVDMARRLVGEGAMVIGVSIPDLVKNYEADQASCVLPDGDFENLSHFIQARAKLPAYHVPLIVGYSSGATWAYAMMAQAPVNTFSGALGLGFCPDLEMRKRLCKGEDVRFTERKDGLTVDLLPTHNLRAPFIALQGEIDQVCSPPATKAYIAQVPNAEVVMLPKVGHGYSVEKNWMPQFLESYRKLSAHHQASQPPPPALPDLPLVEIPATAPEGDTFAVLISGDGGWAGLDKDVANALAARGIPVLGIDSLRYFWTARTPDGLAKDMDNVIRFYANRWKKSKVLLSGYSQGADVMPFAVNRLPEATRAMITRIALVGLGEKAAFEFHFENWFSSDTGDLPIQPEAEKLNAATTICLYGADDKGSLCPKIAPGHVQVKMMPGGHHFDGAYDTIAGYILSGLPTP